MPDGFRSLAEIFECDPDLERKTLLNSMMWLIFS
jgi:hypothetical protein